MALAQLRIEAGAIEEPTPQRLRIIGAGTRAVLPRTGGRGLELRFTYLGPSAATAPLASGEERRQIGLKLRARDTCNVVYVMWHIEPSVGLHVSVKSNPDATRHSQCRDRGYLRLQPVLASTIAPILPGQERTLAARIDADVLRVYVDGVLAWSGRLPHEALEFDGPLGVRSDNGVFDLVLFTR